MAYIKQLIESLFEEESEGNIQSFKKLIYLAVNEQKVFAPYAGELAGIICPILHCIEDNTTKIYTLQLLSELATNYKQQIPPLTYDFRQIIALLSDENVEVRKASHYLLLIFIKKYEMIDEILRAYTVSIRQNPDQWKQIQKIIHSFQSLLVIQPKCVTFPANFTLLDDLMRLVIAFRLHQHQLIQKASQQTVSSFVKNQYTPKIIHKMDKIVLQELGQIAEKLGINLYIKPQQSSFRLQSRKSVESKKLNEIEQLLQSIQQVEDWKVKSQLIQQISKKLSQGRAQVPQALIESMLDLTYDYNFKICITAMNILLTLVSNYASSCSTKLRKIEDIMMDKICDLKMAVRQIAVKILKRIYTNSTKDSAKKLLAKLASCSVVGKEQILIFIQQYYTTVIPIDLGLVLGEVASQLASQNTKIKIKTLDCLVKISLACDIEECKYILSRKLNKVYYDMFLDRLKDRNLEPKERWDDSRNNNLNKGMTWQPDRASNPVQNERNMTKVEFTKKQQRPVQEDTMYDFKFQAPTFGGGEKRQETKVKGAMLGTSHTSNETYSTFDAPEETNLVKFSRKPNQQSYRPSVLSNSQTIQDRVFEQKKLPLKPKPVKKLPLQQSGQEGNSLVIHSKQYQNRTSYEQVKQQKPLKSLKLTKNRTQKTQKTEKAQKIQRIQKQQQRFMDTKTEKSNKQPFSIKKSTSKKQHQLDYKATQYISKEELAPVANPKELLRDIIANLPKDNDWSKQFESLDGLRRLIKNHDQMFPQIHQNLAAIMPQVLKLVESLRSTLAKNGMITLAEMCEAFKKHMDPFLDAIFIKLFKKAQDTNTFIIQQVNKCVRSLCNYCTTAKIINIVISNSQAKATPMKLKVGFCIDRLLQKQGYKLAMLKQNQKLFAVMCNYIVDSSQQVRNLMKEIFINLQGNNSSAQVEAVFRKSPKDVWDKWRTIIDRDLK